MYNILEGKLYFKDEAVGCAEGYNFGNRESTLSNAWEGTRNLDGVVKSCDAGRYEAAIRSCDLKR